MVEFTYVIKDEVGIHARPATLMVKLIKSLSSTVSVGKGGKSCNGTKLMQIMALGIKQGDEAHFTCEGENEAADAAALKDFLEKNL
ncbi:MAG: HPr family phosphocarrier protein [Schwartzia sp.]|nr:HPr family phosphocarrier protein [Schwartzia sp. (in: firmicutes)]